MVVLFSSIYAEKLGLKKIELDLKEPIKLAKLLEYLENEFPQLAGCSGGSIAERYAAQYLCLGSGRILQLNSIITNDDTMEIIPPIMGG